MAEESYFNQNVVNPIQNAWTSLTKGEDLSGLPYDAQAAAIAKRQKLAEMLMQQGQQQPEVLTYKGIAAQPSVAGGLGKALSQFMGAYMGGKAEEDAVKLEKTGNENFTNALGNYYVDPGTPETKIPETNVTLDMPNIPKAVFDKNTGRLALGEDAGTTPTNFNIPAVGLGNATPSHTRTLEERMAYDLSNMSGGNKAQSTHFATQYAADAAKSQAMNQLKPQVDAVLGRTGVPDNIRSDLEAQIASGDTDAVKATLKEYQSKSTAQATVDETLRNALDAGPPGSAPYNTYLAWKLGNVEPPEAFKQKVEMARQQRSIITNSQSGAGIPDNDPAALGYLSTIHSGLGSLRSVPLQGGMRDKVARLLLAEKDPSGSPTVTALQTSAAKKITDPYTSNPHYILYANAQPFLERLKAAAGMNSSIGDVDSLDSLTKLETGGNAITEAMINTNILGQSVKDRINVIKNKFTAQGGILSADQRKEVVQLGQNIYDNYKAGYKDVYTAATKQLNAAKIPSQYWTIPDLNQFESGGDQSNIAPAGTSATLPNGTVVHSDGKGNWK